MVERAEKIFVRCSKKRRASLMDCRAFLGNITEIFGVMRRLNNLV